MTDKQRIEKLLETLVRIKNTLSIAQEAATAGEMSALVDEIKETINVVLRANADIIDLPNF